MGEIPGQSRVFLRLPGPFFLCAFLSLWFNSPMKTRLLHAQVIVADLAAARRFYGRILGFEEAGAYPPDDPTYIEYVPDEGAVFAVMQRRYAAAVGGTARLTFVVPDIRRLWTQWRGIVDAVEPFDEIAADAPLRFALRDPDGNELGFVQE